MSLTHEWDAVHVDDSRHWLAEGWYVFGGQPDDEGRPEYVLHVQDGNGDRAVAAEQIAAALRGEA